MKRHILILAAILSLSSCGIYRKYERPELWFVDSLYRRMEVTADSVSTASISWDRMFTDPILQDWIKSGLEFNHDLNIARLKVQEAEAALLAARWALLPGGQFNMQGGLPGSFTARLDASWELIYSADFATQRKRLLPHWNRARRTSMPFRPSWLQP